MALATGQGDNGIAVKPKDRVDLGDSATQGDILQGAGIGANLAGYNIVNFGPFWGQGNNELLEPLPPYWSKHRDAVLSQTIYQEDFWAGAVSITTTKGASTTFNVEGANDLMARRGQELFLNANGGEGWFHFVSQNLQQFLLTDLGSFIEIDRVDNSKPGSKVVGLYHLDSHRCYLTGDPDKPVIYQDLQNRYHYLTWWQVFHISDMPNPRNNYFGVGFCAASRAYKRIRRLVAIDLYEYEKISGGRPQELNFITGITQNQLDMMLKSNETDKTARGMSVYGGAAVIAMMTKDNNIANIKIPIAQMPDKFDPELEREHAAGDYANALGIDKGDIKALTGRMAGTATQSEVQHSKEQQKGLVLWRSRVEWFANNMVLPAQASFHFISIDLAELKAKADIFSTWATALAGAVGSGGTVMDHDQALQKLVDENQLSPEYLQGQDLTSTVTLDDDEKPLLDTPEQPVDPMEQDDDQIEQQASQEAVMSDQQGV